MALRPRAGFAAGSAAGDSSSSSRRASSSSARARRALSRRSRARCATSCGVLRSISSTAPTSSSASSTPATTELKPAFRSAASPPESAPPPRSDSPSTHRSRRDGSPIAPGAYATRHSSRCSRPPLSTGIASVPVTRRHTGRPPWPTSTTPTTASAAAHSQ